METERATLLLKSDQAAWTAVREMALHRLDQMTGLEAKILRADKPDALHDFRVASRRFEQALDLLSPPEMPPSVRRLRRHLARGRKSISDVRDYDAFLGRVEKLLARKSPPRREAWQAVRDYLAKRRARKYAKAAKKLGKLNLSRTCARLRVLLESRQSSSAKTPHARVKNACAALGDGRFRQRMGAELRRVWREFEDASRQAPDFSSASAIHAMRLAVKRLRYLMEIIHQFETPSSGQALGLLRGLQQRLGEWHDTEMDERLLAKMVGRPEFLRQQLRLAGDVLKLMGQSRRAKARIASRRPTVLDPAASAQLMACVLALLAGTFGKAQPNC
ncbi:MAG: CHAD domain-containing protein [Terriglobia bacterium]